MSGRISSPLSDRANAIVLRPSRDGWGFFGLFAVLFTGVGFLLHFAPNPPHEWRDIGGLVLFACVLMTLPIGLIVWSYVGYVRANADGLAWRTFRGKWSVSWSDVTDYYHKSYHTKNGDVLCAHLKTTRGAFRVTKNWSGNLDAFCAFVQAHAVNAKASSWEFLGTRPAVDWPKTFAYSKSEARTWAIIRGLILAFGPFSVAMIEGPKIVQAFANRPEPGDIYTYLGLVFGSLVFGSISLFAIPLNILLADRRQRQTQSIVVTTEGLRFSEGAATPRFLPWEAIDQCYIASTPGGRLEIVSRYVVEAGGNTLDFSAQIEDAETLQRIIVAHAPKLAVREWRQKPSLDPRDAATRWTGGYPGVGERLYSYRTPTNRGLAALATTYLLAPFVRPALTLAGLGFDTPTNSVSPVILTLCLTAIVWLWWRYRAGGIVLSKTSLTERTPWGERSVHWSDIVSYRKAGGDALTFGVVRDRHGKSIRFWLSIADWDELMSEITARAPQGTGDWKATGSPSKGG